MVEFRLINDDEVQGILDDAGKDTLAWVVDLVHKAGF